MYITINDIKGSKRIDLSHPIKNFNSIKEIAVVSLLSDNLQYNVIKPRTIVANISGHKN